jgi:hypothetical protein
MSDEEKINQQLDFDKRKAKEVFKIEDKVTKKEIKKLLKSKQKRVDKKENIFVKLIKKFQFREYRKRNKKIISHKIH